MRRVHRLLLLLSGQLALALLLAAGLLARSGAAPAAAQVSPCSAITMNLSPGQPQLPGTTVSLRGTATCGGTPTYRFWVQAPGGAWQIVQDYSTQALYLWDTTGLAYGSYNLEVDARNQGSTANYETWVSTSFVLEPALCRSATLSGTPAQPQQPGASVTWTGGASCGGTPQYRFQVQPSGGNMQIAQDYSNSASFAWNTTGLATGTYTVRMDVRNVGSPLDWEANYITSYQLGAAVCVSVTETRTPAPPQQPGTTVTITGTGTCGGQSAVYRFWILPPGGSWALVQDYSTANYQWNTTGKAAGTYYIEVDAKVQGSSADYEAWASWPYLLGSSQDSAPGAVTLTAPANGAVNVGTTPTLSWTAPSGSIAGSTAYWVDIWDPYVAPSGQLMTGSLASVTVTSLTMPSWIGLQAGHSYRWNIVACNGEACGPYAATWFSFSTAAMPNAAQQATPANGATGQSATPTLTWTPPGNAIPGTTTYTVSIWDPYGGVAGHMLGDLPATTSSSAAVPAAESLLYGQSYSWNVNACNGSSCSGYNSVWYSFTTAPQPALTLSGAQQTEVPNGDFAGAAAGATSVPGWSGGVTVAADPGGFTYLQHLAGITSGTVALDYPSRDANGNSVCWFRLGFRPNGGTIQVLFNNVQVAASSAPAGGWQQLTFPIASSAGASGQFTIQGTGTSSTLPDVLLLQRFDGPFGRGGTQAGLDTGAYTAGASDLSLPGVSGISFARIYNTASVSSAVRPSVTATLLGPLGNKWWHNWEYSIWQLTPAVAVVITPGGKTVTYNLANGVWTPPAGVHDTLSLSGSTWTLTTTDQLRFSFTITSSNGTGLTLAPLFSITDRNGNATTLSYDAANTNVVKVTDPGGRYISIAYNASGLISGLSDSAGRSVAYGYTGGDLTTVTDLRSGVTTNQYSGHLLTQVTNQLNHTVLTNSYDGQTRLATQQDAAAQGTVTYSYSTPGAGATRVTDQRGKLRTYYFDQALRVTDVLDGYSNAAAESHDADNNLAEASNGVGATESFTYDAKGNVLTRTDAWNETWTYTYDGLNDPLTVTDPLGQRTQAGYDPLGNLLWVMDALNQSARFAVNALGQVVAVEDKRGYSTHYTYNGSGDQTSVTDALGHTTTIGYDAAGRPTSVTDPLSHTSSATYDAAGHVLTTTDALNHTASAVYDAAGRKTSATDANTHTTQYGYDNRGLLTSVIDAVNGAAHPTSYGYDAVGNRTSVNDANGHTTSYSFDDDNRPLTVTDPLTNVLATVSYDAAGRVATMTDAKTQRTTFAYTLRDQLDTISYADGTAVRYEYDALGRRTVLRDATGSSSYAYDAVSRLTQVQFPNGTVSYGYDAAGNRTSLGYPAGMTAGGGASSQQVSYAYDADERLASVTDWNTQTTSYSYDAAGRLVTATLPSSTGVVSTYSYDNANRLTGISHAKGGSTLASASYTLDAAGNRTAKTTPAGTENYVLDALNRLTSATPPGSTATTYTYDPVGDRVTLQNSSGTTSYAYDAADRLTSVTPPGSGAVANSFDANGSQTGRGADSFSWDAVQRLTSATVGGQTSSFSYNGDNLRVSRSVAGTTTSFVWDIAGGLPLLLDDGSQYVYGAGLVSHITASGTFYYLADGLGSTMALVDGTGTVVQAYDHDAFGKVRSSSGSQSTEFQFAGQQTDPSGLQYLRARYYDPSTGRFLSRDPLSAIDPAAFHPYSYAGNNPALNSDPGGLDAGPSAADMADAVAVYQANQAAAAPSAPPDVLLSNPCICGRTDGSYAYTTSEATTGQSDPVKDPSYSAAIVAGYGGQPLPSSSPVSTAPAAMGSAERSASYACDSWSDKNCLQVGTGEVPVGPEGYQGPPVVAPNWNSLANYGASGGPDVRVGDPAVEGAQAVFDRLSAGGTVVQDPSYPGIAKTLPDGTRIGLRNAQSGPTIDIKAPSSNLPPSFRIHFPGPPLVPPFPVLPCTCLV